MTDKVSISKVILFSSTLGEFLQSSELTPAEAFACLSFTLGRLLAREGYSHLTSQTGWDEVVRSKSLFEAGFRAEREYGSLGRPEGQAIS